MTTHDSPNSSKPTQRAHPDSPPGPRLLASGYIYKEVAFELRLTIETVRTYVKRICHKLRARSKVEAIIK